MCMARIFGGQQGVQTINQSGAPAQQQYWAKSGRPKGGGFIKLMRGVLLRQNGVSEQQQPGAVTGSPSSVTGG